MAKYRKKLVVIEAERWFPGVEIDGVKERETGSVFWKDAPHISPTAGRQVKETAGYIKTLEGRRRAEPGDWIITDAKGEKSVCDADIFEATYEIVEN